MRRLDIVEPKVNMNIVTVKKIDTNELRKMIYDNSESYDNESYDFMTDEE